MTKETAFAKACDALDKAGETRLPVLRYCVVRRTEIGNRKKLDLYDAPGEDRGSKIGAFWMEGDGKLTRYDSHAKRRLVKARGKDYEVHLHDARVAEKKGDLFAKNRALRAAVPSLFSFFEGQIHRLLDAYQPFQEVDPIKLPIGPENRDPSFRDLVSYLCRHATWISGGEVSAPRLRLRAIRNILIHPTAEGRDPFNDKKRLSAIDAINLNALEIESAATEMENFMTRLWRSVHHRKKMARGKAVRSTAIRTRQLGEQSVRNRDAVQNDHEGLTDDKASHAQIELLAARQGDYAAHLKEAKEAGSRGDYDRRACFIRAAIEAQAAVVDGVISRLYQRHGARLASQIVEEPQFLTKRVKLGRLCELAKEISGFSIQPIEFRLFRFRDVSIHPTIDKPVRGGRRLSAVDFQWNPPTPEEIEAQEISINAFFNKLASLLEGKRKRC